MGLRSEGTAAVSARSPVRSRVWRRPEAKRPLWCAPAIRTCSPQPRGKQSQRYENYGCLYTRTTGIWQTVWMEPVPEPALLRPRITPDAGRGRFIVQQPLSENRPGSRLKLVLSDAHGPVSTVEIPADCDLAPVGDLEYSRGYAAMSGSRETLTCMTCRLR